MEKGIFGTSFLSQGFDRYSLLESMFIRHDSKAMEMDMGFTRGGFSRDGKYHVSSQTRPAGVTWEVYGRMLLREVSALLCF
jgi:hypothetical protein